MAAQWFFSFRPRDRMTPRPPTSRRFAAWPAWLCGALAFGLAAARINPGIPASALPHGPGLTPDESFNIQQGVFLCDAVGQHGPLLWAPSVARVVFAAPRYLPDHPPLGRVLIGLAHQIFRPILGGADDAVFHVAAARLGACLMFAVTVFLVVNWTRRQFGTPTAIVSAVLLVLSARVTGHGRLAALETATTLAWWVALLPQLRWFTDDRPPSLRAAALSGVCWGLLLLTKIQAVLLPPVTVLWLIVRFRQRGLLPLLVWSVTGALVWFVGWPWLWEAPATRIMEYLGRTGAERQILYVWYLGERFADRGVPWHYPWLMLAATLSGAAALGLIARIAHRGWQRSEWLLLCSIAGPMTVFSLPGIPVYDGVRLFLFVMPAVAILAARGVVQLVASLRAMHGSGPLRQSRRRQLLSQLALVAAVLSVPFAVRDVFSPFAISRYGPLVGGQAGAEALGLESSYWADGLNGAFWTQVPEGAEVFVAPVSHQFQLTAQESLVPVISQRRIRLTAFEYDDRRQQGLLLLIHRLADLRPTLQNPPPSAEVLVEVRAGNRVLARLIRTPPVAVAESGDAPGDAAPRPGAGERRSAGGP